MTRDEAIARIEDHKIVHKMNEPRAIYISEALDMAIKALEQEPCEDAISREAVIRIAEQGQVQGLEWQFKELIKLPPVTPQSKTGHWTIKQYQVPIENKQVPTVSNITFPTEPTACKIVYTYIHSDCKSEEYLNKYNYCPNCGAKMIEDTGSEG